MYMILLFSFIFLFAFTTAESSCSQECPFIKDKDNNFIAEYNNNGKKTNNQRPGSCASCTASINCNDGLLVFKELRIKLVKGTSISFDKFIVSKKNAVSSDGPIITIGGLSITPKVPYHYNIPAIVNDGANNGTHISLMFSEDSPDPYDVSVFMNFTCVIKSSLSFAERFWKTVTAYIFPLQIIIIIIVVLLIRLRYCMKRKDVSKPIELDDECRKGDYEGASDEGSIDNEGKKDVSCNDPPPILDFASAGSHSERDMETPRLVGINTLYNLKENKEKATNDEFLGATMDDQRETKKQIEEPRSPAPQTLAFGDDDKADEDEEDHEDYDVTKVHVAPLPMEPVEEIQIPAEHAEIHMENDDEDDDIPFNDEDNEEYFAEENMYNYDIHQEADMLHYEIDKDDVMMINEK